MLECHIKQTTSNVLNNLEKNESLKKGKINLKVIVFTIH